MGEALRNAPLTAIYASPLERALETAQSIAQARHLHITQEPELMDINIGEDAEEQPTTVLTEARRATEAQRNIQDRKANFHLLTEK